MVFDEETHADGLMFRLVTICNRARFDAGYQDLVLEMDVHMHISAILGIYASLRTIIGPDPGVLAWLQSSNLGSTFGGRPPIELILGGISKSRCPFELIWRPSAQATDRGLWHAPTRRPNMSKGDVIRLMASR